jgi:hypothetical protein
VTTVNYALRNSPELNADSGDAQSSHYRYSVPVPQYGDTANTSWRVTRITAQDGRGHTAKFSAAELLAMGARFDVVRTRDTFAPVVTGVEKGSYDQPDRVFDDGSGVTLRYEVIINDEGLGVRRGALTLQGPGGTKITTNFEVVKNPGDYYWTCGANTVFPPATFVVCLVDVRIPAGSPSGAWSISKVRAVDVLGNAAVYTDDHDPVIKVSRNDVLTAGGFAMSPEVVDNWRQPVDAELRFTPAGAVGGVTSVDIQTGYGCSPLTATPTANGDGTMSVAVPMNTWTDRCEVNGIALTDGAGHEAYYGEPFLNAPLTGLVVTRVPDTTPPVVTSVSLPKATWTTTEIDDAWGIGVRVYAEDVTGSPLSSVSSTIYDADGVSQGGGGGGIFHLEDGSIDASAFTSGLQPGTYTIGIMIYDAAGNVTAFGSPNGLPTPGGPLVLTVVEG